MRLIDGDKLKERLYHEAFETDSEMQKWDGGCWIRYKMFEEAVKNSETVEADPVRHGHWELAIGYDPKRSYKCSVCDKMAYEPSAYCPACGALIDEVEE